MLMDYVKFYNLKPADRILVPKSLAGIIQHHVIYLGCNHLGQHLIAENVVGYCVRVVGIEQFFAENPSATKIIRFEGDGSERRRAVERALKEVGKPYSLIDYNCEHFANYVQHGKPSSLQIGNAFLILLVFVVVGVLLMAGKR